MLARSGRFPPFCGKPPAARMATTCQACGGRWPLRSIHSLRLSLSLQAPPRFRTRQDAATTRRLRRPPCMRTSSRCEESPMLPRLADSPASRRREIRRARDPKERAGEIPDRSRDQDIPCSPPHRRGARSFRFAEKRSHRRHWQSQPDARTPGMRLSSLHCRAGPNLPRRRAGRPRAALASLAMRARPAWPR